MDSPSTPAAPLLTLTRRYASQTICFEIANGFGLPVGSSCTGSCPSTKPGWPAPLGSTRITGLLSYHGAVRHCASASVLCALRVRRLWALPLAVGRPTSTVAFRLRCIGAQLRTFHADA